MISVLIVSTKLFILFLFLYKTLFALFWRHNAYNILSSLTLSKFVTYSGGNQHLQQSKTLNISFKCCSKFKSRDSFGNCLSWGFQNTPNMLKLIEFWLRYLRSKTNDMILKISSKFIEIDENLMKTKLFETKIFLVTFATFFWHKKLLQKLAWNNCRGCCQFYYEHWTIGNSSLAVKFRHFY